MIAHAAIAKRVSTQSGAFCKVVASFSFQGKSVSMCWAVRSKVRQNSAQMAFANLGSVQGGRDVALIQAKQVYWPKNCVYTVNCNRRTKTIKSPNLIVLPS